jgi:hypothetical protein
VGGYCKGVGEEGYCVGYGVIVESGDGAYTVSVCWFAGVVVLSGDLSYLCRY